LDLSLRIFVRRILGAVLVAGLLVPASLANAEPEAGPPSEAFHYRWELNNVLGLLAGLVFPRHGKGDLSFKPDKSGTMRSELVISSPGNTDAYWRYGSEIDTHSFQPLRAWSAYLWRGKLRSKTREITQKGVFDLVSAIYSLRRDPPRTTQVRDIWTDGDVYPVDVEPRGVEHRDIGGRWMNATHFALRPVDLPGRLRWKGKVDLWYALDATSTPVEIDIARSLADLRLELESTDGGS
jgi:hypothetical protein